MGKDNVVALVFVPDVGEGGRNEGKETMLDRLLLGVGV
jgi:hypothetical protein